MFFDTTFTSFLMYLMLNTLISAHAVRKMIAFDKLGMGPLERRLLTANANQTDKLMDTKAKRDESFNFLEFLKDSYAAKQDLIKKKHVSRAKKCVENLRLEDKLNNFTVKNWTCKVIKEKKTKNMPLLCSCSYEYQCIENEKIYFSPEYNDDLKQKNRLNSVYRGADFQCENYLVNKTKKAWSCQIGENKEAQSADEKHLCDCFHKSTCRNDRFVDFY